MSQKHPCASAFGSSRIPLKPESCARQGHGGGVTATKSVMRHLPLPVLIPALTLFLSSCGSFNSYPVGEKGELPQAASSKQGLHYFLPRSRLTIEGSYNDIKASDGKTTVRREYVISMKKYNVADPDAPVFAEITENVMYDEDSVVTVKDGLLQSANAKPEDKTGEIIVTLVGTAIDVGRIVASGPMALDVLPPPAATRKPVTPFLVDFDPFIASEVADARHIIERAGFSLTSPTSASLDKVSVPVQNEGSGKKKQPDHYSGLAFRPPTAMKVLVSLNADEFEYQDEMEGEGAARKVKIAADGAKMYRSSLTVPNVGRGRVAYVPVKRGFMVKRQTNVVFEDGMPTSFDLKAPSPVLGFVKIPAAIAKMVGDAIPTLIKINRDTTKGDLAYQTDLLKAQSELIKAQNDLNALKQPAP